VAAVVEAAGAPSGIPECEDGVAFAEDRAREFYRGPAKQVQSRMALR
jgi:hypothetical protein